MAPACRAGQQKKRTKTSRASSTYASTAPVLRALSRMAGRSRSLPTFGWRRAARVIGWCVLVSALGEDELACGQKGPGRSTQWRVQRDLKKLRQQGAPEPERVNNEDVEFLMKYIRGAAVPEPEEQR